MTQNEKKYSIKELFYYLTEAVQVRYKDSDMYASWFANKEFRNRREELYQFIKDLETMYKSNKTYILKLNYTDIKWLEQKLSVIGVGHQEAHNIMEAINKAEADDTE